MIFFLFLGLVPSALTKDSPHSLRAIYSLPAFLTIAAYGLCWLVSLIERKIIPIVLISAYILVILGSTLKFLLIFHGPYIRDAARDWQTDYKIIGENVIRFAPLYNNIYFTDGFNLMALWWYLHIDPQIFINATDRRNLGKYHFGIKNAQAIPKTESILFVGPEPPLNGRLIALLSLPNGQEITSLWTLE